MGDMKSIEYWKNSYFELQEINKNLQWIDAEKLNKINQLQKENEELKTQIEKMRYCKTCDNYGMLYQNDELKSENKQILEDNDYWQDMFSKSDKENAELKKDKEYLDKVNNEQTEIILKLDEQIEKLTKMLDMAIDDIYNETLVIHRTKEEFIDIYKSNLENKIMGETKDESISL